MSTSPLARCPQCGARTEEDRRICSACGVELAVPAGPFRQPRFEVYWSPSGTPWSLPPGQAMKPGELPLWEKGLRSLMAAGETALALALSPARAFSGFRLDGGFLAPAVYAVLVGGPCLLLGSSLRAFLSGGPGPVSGLEAVALFFIAPPLYLYLRAQGVHLTLVMESRARVSFEGTFRVVGYANASVAPLLLLPYGGEFLFLVAGTMVEATGIRAVHKLTQGEALRAELVIAAVLILSLLAALFLGLLSWSQARG